MSLDLARFHKTFFEESFENLETMEQALLRLDVAAFDAEVINTIFRAAHSIKGGAATFGFSAVASFTHHAETLLDQMRSGARALAQDDIELLLRAGDTMRGLLTAARDGGDADVNQVAEVQAALERALSGKPAAAPVAATKPAAAAPSGWRIGFAPKPDLFRSGNDPLRILRALGQLGTLQSTALLPDELVLRAAEPETSYLTWNLTLDGEARLEAVRDCFAWVEDECELSFEPNVAAAVAVAVEIPEPATPAPVVASRSASIAKSDVPVAARGAKPANDGASIRVGTEKIDALINLVGELVITQAMLTQLASGLDPVHNEKLLSGLGQLDRNTRMLQEAVMATRMLPMEAVFSRFPRLVRDLAGKLGKQVRLVTVGEQTELDKSVIEKIIDPLNHLVRNSLDHGLEKTEDRIAAGKEATGTILLKAAHQGGHIVIEVGDDGRGLNRQKILAKAQEKGVACNESMSDAEVYQLIFAPGFSTADQVTDVSGRGVGMDVVKKNIQALGGTVELSSTPGKGAAVLIRLPLTLAILDGMSVGVGDDIFILPLSSVVESLQPQPDQVKRVAQAGTVVRVRNEYLPLVDLREWFALPGALRPPQEAIVVIVESEGRKVAMQIDELVGQQQVVIKSLEANYRRVRGVSGATILGDGRVSLILDVAAVVRLFSHVAAA
ncbi:MAG: chemotaxis protein CheA [Panacagrimonas sp.]|jgi:two-component system chemotaxis sensor kinase CheA|nr:chemotaxis protein CheW [Panacagrimonas sp.]MCC2655864.1 chemotaxis protein CheA [Panacagrimonas sp.]